MTKNFNVIRLLERGDRRPVNISDAEWQQMFDVLRFTTPISKDKRFKPAPNFTINGVTQKEKETTQWRYYTQYINNVLSNIRNGEHDICYFIYQIKDLLQFENTKLKTKLVNDDGFLYFDVWLEV